MKNIKLVYQGFVILSILSILISTIPSYSQPVSSTDNEVVLITGFQPFDIYDVNPSELVALEMNDSIIQNVTIKGYVLPVNYTTAPQQMKQLINQFQPDLILCLGLAGNAKKIAVEKLAINLRINPEARFPLFTLRKINVSGSWFHQATYNSSKIVHFIQEEDIPVEISYSAGLYLCNAILYETLQYQKTFGELVPTGFIHLPPLISQNPEEGMTLETMIDAVAAAIISHL